MKHLAGTAIVGSLLLTMATACGSDKPAASSGDTKITAAAANNYSFSSSLTLTNQAALEKSTLTFDWSQVTKDMYGRTIDPKADIGGFVVSIWNYTKEDLQDKVNHDEIVVGDRKGAGIYFTHNNATQVDTTMLTSDGTLPITPANMLTYFSASSFPAPANTFLVMIQKDGKNPGKQGRMLTTFSLSTDSNAPTSVVLNNSSANLVFAADFSKLTPTPIPAGKANVLVDWSSLTKTPLGRVFEPMMITRMIVASYDLPTSELQKNENFIELESLATGLWESDDKDIVSPQLSLSKLKNSSGQAFTGIDSNHATWIMALECTDCMNPAPWYLTVLQPS